MFREAAQRGPLGDASGVDEDIQDGAHEMSIKDGPRHRTAGPTAVGSTNTRTIAVLLLLLTVLVIVVLVR